MNGFDAQRRQDYSLKRRWQENTRKALNSNTTIVLTNPRPPSSHHLSTFLSNPKTFPGLDDDDLLSTVVPPVTVVLEGRSICQRISLHKHASYHSLAKALRQMFVDSSDSAGVNLSEADLNLSNAIPGHLVAYQDMENDLLLAGDLNWKDFVRVAKRIRILPAKANSRKGKGGGA